MKECLEKEGVVVAKLNGEIVVRFARKSACADCHAQQSCSSQDVQEQTMGFAVSDLSEFTVGDSVSIQTTRHSLKMAVVFAFIFPLILLLLGLSLSLFTSITTVVGYWITAAIIFLYYLLLYFSKNRMRHLVPVQIINSKLNQ